MTILKNLSLIVLGAGLGIATVFLARCFLTNSSDDKKSKTKEDKTTKIYVIPCINDEKKEIVKNLEVSSLSVQNQNNKEPIVDETVKTIIDGIALIKDQTKELTGIGKDKCTDQIYSVQYQNNEEAINRGNTSENSTPFNEIPPENNNIEKFNGHETKKTTTKTYERIKNTSVYLISATKSDDIREIEVSDPLVQNWSEESTVNQTKNAIVDGVALIHNQNKEPVDNQEKERKSTAPVYSDPVQNNEEPVNGGSTFETLITINQIPAQNVIDVVSNNEEKEKIVRKTFVKKSGEDNGGVVLEYPQTESDAQHWNLNVRSATSTQLARIFGNKSNKGSSTQYEDANNKFISLPSEELVNEKLNTTIFQSFEDATSYKPFKPPRIRRSSKGDVFEKSKFNKNNSTISSRKPSAQSTLLEANKKIEVKESDGIQILAEESNIQHSTFRSDTFLESRHKTLGHQLWRRYVYALSNLFSWKRRASDRSKLLDSPYSTEKFGKRTNLIDIVEDHEVNFNKHKKFK